MKKAPGFFIFLFIFSLSACAQDTTQKVVSGRFNSIIQKEKPYVILISIDGFRWDYAKKFGAKNILKFGRKGVSAGALIPSYPSLTFPNHYTIATGLYPAHHGLVDNAFYDRNSNRFYRMKKTAGDSSLYGGTPLWVLAENQNMLSASFYWVGSEAAIKGKRPTYYYKYNELIPVDTRINELKKWLELSQEKRPHLITFYFPEVDHAGHAFGPNAVQTASVVKQVDSTIKKMVEMTEKFKLNINYVLVSDHGMGAIDTADSGIPMPEALDTSKFIIAYGSSIILLYAKDTNDIAQTYAALKASAKDYDVYLPDETPDHWHYKKIDDKFNRIGDIILVPHYPHGFNFYNRKYRLPGEHGFDPEINDMQAIFYAWGPKIKKHRKVKPFSNIHIYPFIARILGLNMDSVFIDGDTSVLQKFIKE